MAIRDRNNLRKFKTAVDLSGPNGNAFVLMGIGKKVYDEIGASSEYFKGKSWNEIQTDMMSGDYEHLLEVFNNYFGEFVDLYR